jgi:hypothetical protein
MISALDQCSKWSAAFVQRWLLLFALHMAQLLDCLRSVAGVGVDWVGSGRGSA